MHSAEYSILEREGRLVHLKRAWAPGETMKTVNLHSQIYIEVAGIYELWEHVRNFKDRYQVRDIIEREYGMTEFHIREPHSCLVFVGQATAKRAAGAAS